MPDAWGELGFYWRLATGDETAEVELNRRAIMMAQAAWAEVDWYLDPTLSDAERAHRTGKTGGKVAFEVVMMLFPASKVGSLGRLAPRGEEEGRSSASVGEPHHRQALSMQDCGQRCCSKLNPECSDSG